MPQTLSHAAEKQCRGYLTWIKLEADFLAQPFWSKRLLPCFSCRLEFANKKARRWWRRKMFSLAGQQWPWVVTILSSGLFLAYQCMEPQWCWSNLRERWTWHEHSPHNPCLIVRNSESEGDKSIRVTSSLSSNPSTQFHALSTHPYWIPKLCLMCADVEASAGNRQ